MALSDYRALLSGVDTGGLILEEGRAATGYERSVAATLTLAWDKLSPAAAQLLSLCAFAAPEPLPERFFLEAAEVLPEELAKTVRDTLAWNRTVGELRRYALAQRLVIPTLEQGTGKTEENALLLHRLTQVVVRARDAQPERDVRTLQAILRTVCPQDSNLPKNWPRYAALAEHIGQLHHFLGTGWLEVQAYSWLLDRLATYLQKGPALYEASIRVFWQTLEIVRHTLGEDHPDTLSIMNNLASALVDQGDLAGARALQEQVLKTQLRLLGEEHPDTLVCINNIADMLWRQGDLDGARTLEKQVLETRRRVLGVEHPDTLVSMNNLATTLLKQGDLAGARSLHEQVLTARSRLLGDDHPSTLISMSNLADTLSDQGDLAGARALQERVLEIRRRLQGEDHPSTLTSMNNLAYTLSDQGDLAGTRALQEQVLEALSRRLGDEHPNTLSSINNLSITLWKIGERAKALALMQAAAVGSVRVLGPAHPDAVASLEAYGYMQTLILQANEDQGAPSS